MFLGLLHIVHDDGLGIGLVGIDGTLHGVGTDFAVFDAHKNLGRKAHQRILEPKFVFSFGTAKNVAQRKVGADRHAASQVDEADVARLQVVLNRVETLPVGFGSRKVALPAHGLGVFGLCLCGIAHRTEVEQAFIGVNLAHGQHNAAFGLIVDDENERNVRS